MIKKMIVLITACGIVFATPYVSYAGGMTGGTTGGSKQDRNWKDKSSNNNSKLGKVGKAILDKINPYSPLVDAAEKFSEKYDKFRKKKGDVVTGTGVVRKKRR
tara:strand:- start:168 stop:476 length:309 start_codon:yes stop_codon:yes gene_type:complete